MIELEELMHCVVSDERGRCLTMRVAPLELLAGLAGQRGIILIIVVCYGLTRGAPLLRVLLHLRCDTVLLLAAGQLL